jgi:four helix bundle protein
MTRALPNNPEGWVFGKQVLRCATSVAANYRAAGRARSKPEFVAKIGVVVEEADETVFWLELIRDAGLVPVTKLQPLIDESNELLAILAASYHHAKSSLGRASGNQ